MAKSPKGIEVETTSNKSECISGSRWGVKISRGVIIVGAEQGRRLAVLVDKTLGAKKTPSLGGIRQGRTKLRGPRKNGLSGVLVSITAGIPSNAPKLEAELV